MQRLSSDMTVQDYSDLPAVEVLQSNLSFLCSSTSSDSLRFDDHSDLINCSLWNPPFASELYGNISASSGVDSFNYSTNLPYQRFQVLYGLWHVILTSVLLGLFILCTIIGNVFVVAAIILEKNLQSVSNYLILSLAVADLMVATLVMPISALQELSKSWWLGIELCDIWICFDVLCCTASILHLVAIAIDRYWAVTNVEYIRKRTAKRIVSMIVLVWMISIIISIPARFHIDRNHQKERSKVLSNGECLINQDKGYTIFSVIGAFYCPMIFMLILYMRIYQTARARIRRKHFQKHSTTSNALTDGGRESTILQQSHKCSSVSINMKMMKRGEIIDRDFDVEANIHVNVEEEEEEEDEEDDSYSLKPVSKLANNNHEGGTSFTKPLSSHEKKNGKVIIKSLLSPKPKRKMGRQEKTGLESQRERLEHKRERKAARTLAIITGCFLLCWLPFFIHATVMPFCDGKCAAKEMPQLALSFFLWQGYLNSLLNPVIYTIFAPDFRNAFRKILFGRYYKARRTR